MPRRFGVELELADETNDRNLFLSNVMARRMTELTTRKAKFRQRIAGCNESPSTFNVKQDGGPEITTPALIMCASNIKKFSDWIKAIHQYFYMLGIDPDNVECDEQGIHIHLEKGRLTARQKANVMKAFYLFEPVIFKIVNPYRKDSGWCDSIRDVANGLALDWALDMVDEYCREYYEEHGRMPSARLRKQKITEFKEKALSDTNLFEQLPGCLDHRNGVDPTHRHTFEIRYSHSSIDPEYVVNWVLLNMMIYHVALNWGAEMTLHGVENVNENDLLVFLNEVKMPKYLSEHKRKVCAWIKKQAGRRRRY